MSSEWESLGQQSADGGQLLLQLGVDHNAQARAAFGGLGRGLPQNADQILHADGQKNHRHFDACLKDLIGGPAAHYNDLRALFFGLLGYGQRTAETGEVKADFVLQAQLRVDPLDDLVTGAFRGDNDNGGHAFLD